ncbi:MAG: hypothetical protein ABI203_10600 [Mucilaginibacter sp.]
MRTVTVDILDDKAINLLKDLETLNVIKLHDTKEGDVERASTNMSAKYGGSMSKQSREEIDKQLDELRNSWD